MPFGYGILIKKMTLGPVCLTPFSPKRLKLSTYYETLIFKFANNLVEI